MEDAKNVEVLSGSGAIEWLNSSPLSLQEQICDTTVGEDPADDLAEFSPVAVAADENSDQETPARFTVAITGRRHRPAHNRVRNNLGYDNDEDDDDEENGPEDLHRETQIGDDGEEATSLAEGDSCDFCGMERAVELCRGDECKQLLSTNFPLYCASCSQTLHRRYPHHRRFVDTDLAQRRARSPVVSRHEEYEEKSLARQQRSFARGVGGHSSDDLRYRPYSPKSVHCTQAGNRRSGSFRFGSGIGLAHAQRLVASRSRSMQSVGPGGAAPRPQMYEPSPSTTPRSRPSDLSSKPSVDSAQSDPETNDPRSLDWVSSDLSMAKSSVRANQLQPVHERYQILLQYMKSNPGQSLQEAYRVTGMARSTVLGTRCVAELRLVDPELYSETLASAGPKVKVAQLNRMCQDVLSQPDLEVIVADMRLKSELLPFSSQLSRQLQFCLEANRTGVNPYARD